MAWTQNATNNLIIGVTNGVAASAGQVGELISSIITGSSAIQLPNGSPTNLTSIPLTPGDWDIWGNVYQGTQGLYLTQSLGWISATSASTPDSSVVSQSNTGGASIFAQCVPMQPVNITANTTYYLSTIANFSSGTVAASGAIYARRRR